MRLFHKLFLLVSVTALIAAFAVATALSWNLTRGFSDYVDAQDRKELQQLAQAAADILEAQRQRMGPATWQPNYCQMIDALARDGLLTDAGRRPPFAGRKPPQRPRGGPPGEGGRRRPPPPFPGDARPGGGPPPMDFAARLMLFDADGQRIMGPPAPPPDRKLRQIGAVPIVVAGEAVGSLEVLPRGPETDDLGRRFLKRQYTSAGIVVALMIILAALPAYVFARAGSRRLLTLQETAQAIAGRDLGARAAVSGRDEIAALAENINKMAGTLEQLESARRRWLAELGHELRTPLTVLLGELEALRDGVRPHSPEAIDSLWEEAQQLNLLVEDLRVLALSDLSALPCDFQPLEPARLLETLGERFRPAFSGAGLSLELDVSDLDGISVHWDKGRLDQLISNLLTNAVRYTDAPGTVKVSLSPEGDSIRLTVEDSAPGVATDHMANLFEPLFRAEAARDRASGGSGLGLSVCAAIAKAHGGSITAGPSPLGGLRVETVLPKEARGSA